MTHTGADGRPASLNAASPPASLAEYFLAIRRRRWVVLIALLVVPLAAGIYSVRQPAKYRATAAVLLNQNIASAIANVPASDTLSFSDPERFAATQADVARSPLLAQRVVAAADVGVTSAELLASSDVAPRANADMLRFSVAHGSPQVAARLATTYADQYASFSRDLDTQALRDALRRLQAQIDLLEGRHGSPLYAQLLDAQTKLETAETLVTANSTPLWPAYGASKIAPRPTLALILGALTGLALGLGLVFLLEALNNRPRFEHEVENWLGTPLLGTLPRSPIQVQRAGKLVMLASPESPAGEAFRQLRTHLEVANIETRARAIIVTSAVEREGRTTTAANLSIALARAGRRVVLVDLDLRRPSLHRLFGTSSSPGVTDVSLGAAKLEDVLERVAVGDHQYLHVANAEGEGADVSPLSPLSSPESSDGTSNGLWTRPGTLELLPVGSIPLNPADFVAERGLEQVLATLRERADIVLIDTPPMLSVGDAKTLSVYADALLAVVRLRQTPRAALVALASELKNSPATTLGFIATDAAFEGGFSVGYGGLHRGRAVTSES